MRRPYIGYTFYKSKFITNDKIYKDIYTPFKVKNNNTIYGIIIKPPKLSTKKTIIFTHGNYSDISDTLILKDIAEISQTNIISYDASGFGFSSGVASEIQHIKDLITIYNFAKQSFNIKPEDGKLITLVSFPIH